MIRFYQYAVSDGTYARLLRPGETINEGRILRLVTENEPGPEYRRELAQKLDFSEVTFLGEEVRLENYCELGKEQTGPFFPMRTDMDRIIQHCLQPKNNVLDQDPEIITLKFDRKDFSDGYHRTFYALVSISYFAYRQFYPQRA